MTADNNPCPYCREMHEPSRGFSFDGFGINGCNMYRSRIATFTTATNEDDRQQLGPLFEAALDMLAALRGCLGWLETLELMAPVVTDDVDRAALAKRIEITREAIAKATSQEDSH